MHRHIAGLQKLYEELSSIQTEVVFLKMQINSTAERLGLQPLPEQVKL